MSKKKIITHSGSFHPDDVFAVATISLVFDDVEITRTRDPEVVKGGDFVVDVGTVYDKDNNFFDHHQEGGAGERENKIPYASFGLVWKKFGIDLCGDQRICDMLDRKIVQPIDSADNGVEICSNIFEDVYPYRVQDVIFSFLPTWIDGDSDMDKRFLKAVDFARGILLNEIKILKDLFSAESFVEDSYKNSDDKRVVILDKAYPWIIFLNKYKEPVYVVYPQGENWNVKGVRDGVRQYTVRKEFPEAWAGKRESQLSEISGVPDAVFCHNKRFMCVAKSREGAIALAKRSLEC